MILVRQLLAYLLLSVTISSLGKDWREDEIRTLAVINQPVVDLVIKPPLFSSHPASPDQLADGTCRRAHQGLMNEVVGVVAIEEDMVQIACDNVVYGFEEKTHRPLNTFWVARNKLSFFSEMPPVCWQAFSPAGEMAGTTIVLTLPWKRYSVGTRFVRASEYDTPHLYGVRLFDAARQVLHSMQIPKHRARLEVPLAKMQARLHFVHYAHALIRHVQQSASDAVIPYVWGGSSYVTSYKDHFVLKGGCWERAGNNNPYMGYDCSELVLRLAQISGIPYTCKITSLMSKMLREVASHEDLEEGDLIWFPGHVMIIASLPDNAIIEARGYGAGYGKVQKVALKDYFQGVESYEQLRAVARYQRPLVLLKKDGSVYAEIKEIKFFKLIS